ncbi:hypothetical protein ACFZA1_41675 [Streptomyces filipinensis]|uniref:hypothetical protein n=1 Tax=Streptomyces filipinensis TaxID=66887 RepID=UPI0036E45D25
MTNEAATTKVLSDALRWQEKGTPELTPLQVASTVARLEGGAEQEGISLEEYVLKLVDKMDVSSPRPDTASCFWSWQVEVDHPTDPEKGKVQIYNQHIARAYTDLENEVVEDSMRYLEGTPGGQELSGLYLWDRDVQAGLHLNVNTNEGNEFAGRIWSALSKRYAQEVGGEALFFMEELNPGAVAYQTEAPQLRRDGKLDQVHFMYPLSPQKLEGFPPEIQELLSSDTVRAQVHTFPYDEKTSRYTPTPLTEAGYLDLDHLRSLGTPEAQRAAVLEVCARVAMMDGREADAEQLIGEIQTLAPEHEVAMPDSTALAWAASERMKDSPEQSVSTHGEFLPGVEVNGSVGPVQPQPLKGSAQALTADFMPGVATEQTVKPEQAPATAPAAKAETQAAKPAMSVPVWQVGLNAVPTKLTTAPSGPSTAPSSHAPNLGKETAETGLG